MTTIIAKHGELFGDRRKVVNAYQNGVIGIRDEAKIAKLPFCLYGLTGWDFVTSKNRNHKTIFEQKLAVISALDYFTNGSFTKHPLYKLLKEALYSSSFISLCYHFRDLLGRNLAENLNGKSLGMVMLTRHNTFTAGTNGWNRLDHKDTLVIGAGKKAAAILLDHNLPINEVYYALRASGVPTGTVFDKFTVQEDVSDDFPPVFGEEFIKALSKFSITAMKSEARLNEFNPKERFEQHKTITTFVAALLSLGKMEGNTVIFASDPNLDIDTEEFQHTDIWKKASGITGFDSSKEPK